MSSADAEVQVRFASNNASFDHVSVVQSLAAYSREDTVGDLKTDEKDGPHAEKNHRENRDGHVRVALRGRGRCFLST